MAVSLLTYANRAKVAAALTEQGYPVTRMTVNRWASGGEMPGIAAQMIGELFGHTHEEAAPPQWARRLAQDTAMAVIGALAPEAEQRAAAALIARLEGLPQPNGDSPHGSEEAISQDELEPRERGRG